MRILAISNAKTNNLGSKSVNFAGNNTAKAQRDLPAAQNHKEFLNKSKTQNLVCTYDFCGAYS